MLTQTGQARYRGRNRTGMTSAWASSPCYREREEQAADGADAAQTWADPDVRPASLCAEIGRFSELFPYASEALRTISGPPARAFDTGHLALASWA
jgi:hypothetical protein